MSAVGTELDLGLRLLDDQLFDADGHRCGRVDDIQLKGAAGSRTEVSDLLVGSGAWQGRLRRPFGYAIDGIAPDHMIRIPWTEVTRVGTSVRLSRSAKELGLEAKDGRNVQWLGAPPRGTIRLSGLLRSRLVSTLGIDLGRIWDIRVERETQVPDENVNESWRVVGLVTGPMGWRERIGMVQEGDSTQGENFVPWDSVQNLAPGALTTR